MPLAPSARICLIRSSSGEERAQAALAGAHTQHHARAWLSHLVELGRRSRVTVMSFSVGQPSSSCLSQNCWFRKPTSPSPATSRGSGTQCGFETSEEKPAACSIPMGTHLSWQWGTTQLRISAFPDCNPHSADTTLFPFRVMAVVMAAALLSHPAPSLGGSPEAEKYRGCPW